MEVATIMENCIYSTMQLQTQNEVIKLLNRVTFFTPEVFLNERQFFFLPLQMTEFDGSKGDLTSRN